MYWQIRLEISVGKRAVEVCGCQAKECYRQRGEGPRRHLSKGLAVLKGTSGGRPRELIFFLCRGKGRKISPIWAGN